MISWRARIKQLLLTVSVLFFYLQIDTVDMQVINFSFSLQWNRENISQLRAPLIDDK